MGVYEIRRRQLRNGSYTGGDYVSVIKAARLTYGLGESTTSSHQRIYPEASSHTRDVQSLRKLTLRVIRRRIGGVVEMRFARNKTSLSHHS